MTAEPIYSVPCFCGGSEVERFGGVFRCRGCREEVSPEYVRDVLGMYGDGTLAVADD